MKKISLILSIIVLISYSCNYTKQNVNKNNPKTTYERIYDEKSWGFINEKGDTIIQLGKYKFLNPIDDKNMIFAQLLNGKYGYIDINENILIPFIYDDISVFSNDLASATIHYKSGYLNRKGKTVIPFEYNHTGPFLNCGVATVSKNRKWGTINKKGEIIIPLKYSYIDYHQKDSLFFVHNERNKIAIFNHEGKQLTKFIYDTIYGTAQNIDYFDENFLFNGLLLVKKNGKYEYINRNMQSIKNLGYFSKAEPINKFGYAIVKKNNKYGIINSKGKIVIPIEFDLIKHPDFFPYQGFKNEFYIKKNNKFGILNEQAKQITDIIYDKIVKDYIKEYDKNEIIFKVKNNDKFGIVDRNGNVICKTKYKKIGIFDGDTITIAKKDNLYGLIKYNDQVILPFEYKDILTYNDENFYILIDKNDLYAIVDKKSLKPILPNKYQEIYPCFYSDNRYIVKRNNKYGIINKKSKIIVPFEYDEISNRNRYGENQHLVLKNGKKGIINSEGKIIIPIIYDNIYIDNERLIKVKKNGLYGTINWKNEIIHPIKYTNIIWEPTYINGKRMDTVYLEYKGKYYASDLKGNVIDKPISKKTIIEKYGYLLQ